MSKIKLVFHTEDAGIRNLIQDYWEIDERERFVNNAKDIASEFGLATSMLTKAVRQHASAFATDKQCSNCGNPYPLFSRTEFTQRQPTAPWECSDCYEERRARLTQEKQTIEEAQRRAIHQFWEPSNQPARLPEDFSLRDVLYFLSMVRGGADEACGYIIPVESFSEPLTPEPTFTLDVLKYVYNRGLLNPHPGSPITAFSFTEGIPKTFYLNKVFWVEPEWAELRETAIFLESLIKEKELPLEWQKDIPTVWREIVLQEGLELLQHYSIEHNFSLNIGEKTIDTLTSILEDYSVAQLQNFLWRATRDAAAYYVRENIPKARAANSIITRLQGSYERSKANGWEVSQYGRRFNLPQSIVSKVFFNAVMKMPDTYREKAPPRQP